jgi:hypothetical protein
VHVALGLDAHPWSNFTVSSLGFLGTVEFPANMAVEENIKDRRVVCQRIKVS